MRELDFQYVENKRFTTCLKKVSVQEASKENPVQFYFLAKFYTESLGRSSRTTLKLVFLQVLEGVFAGRSTATLRWQYSWDHTPCRPGSDTVIRRWTNMGTLAWRGESLIDQLKLNKDQWEGFKYTMQILARC